MPQVGGENSDDRHLRGSWDGRTRGLRTKTLTLYFFIADDSGATAIEYGLIAALVSIAGITALSSMGGSLGGVFDGVVAVVTEARCVEVGSNCAAGK